MLSLPENLSDLTLAASRYDILLCSETLVADISNVTELLVPGYGRPVMLCRGRMPRFRGMANPRLSEYGCCEMLVFRVCGVRQN